MGFCFVCNKNIKLVKNGLCLKHSRVSNKGLTEKEKEMIAEHKENIKLKSLKNDNSNSIYKKKLKDESWVGFVYLIEHKEYKLQKIGITNNPSSRLLHHKKNGFEIIEIFVGSPESAARIEHEFIKFIDSININDSSIRFDGSDGIRFEGYTESWRSEFLRIGSISSIVDISGMVRIPIPYMLRNVK